VRSQDGYLFSKSEYASSITSGENFIWPGIKTLQLTSDLFTPFATNINIRLGGDNNLGDICVHSQDIRFTVIDSSNHYNDAPSAAWKGQPVTSGNPITTGDGEFIISISEHEPFQTNISLLPGQTIDLGQIHLRRQTAIIRVVSSDESARFHLAGPQQLDARGSVTFSNVICGNYKIIAAMDGLEFESNVEAIAAQVNSVEYVWRTLKIRVESDESLHIYLGSRVVGEKTATIRVPLGKAEILLRGKGTTKVRSYDDGGWSDYETYEIEFYEKVPLKLQADEHVAHFSGTLGVYRSMPSKARPYEVFVEQEDER
jgi:hypothetical protein